MKRGCLILLLFLIVFFTLNGPVSAQQPSLGDTPGNTDLLLTVNMLPEIPGIYELVNISIESYASFDINAAVITWSLNGKVQKEGIGEKRFSFTTGGPGSLSTIKISVAPLDSFAFTKVITIQPSEVDLLWEAKTYAPPFYLGRSLYTTESKIVFEAIPHFVDSTKSKTPVPRENLIYRWTVGGYFYSDASGYGKSFFTYVGSIFEKREKVELVVLSTDGKLSAKKELTISPVTPTVLAYENHPLYGYLYNREVGSKYTLGDKEVSVVASPYFFSTENSGFDLVFSWLVNGQPTTYTGLRNEIVLRQEGDAKGSTNISVSVENAGKLLQSGNKDFFVLFGNN